MISPSLVLTSTTPPPSSLTLTVEPLANIRAEWIELANTCPEATFYQRHRWLNALPLTYGFNFQTAALRDRGGTLIAAALLARNRNPFSRRWTSLPCSDSAPALARDERARQELLLQLARSRFASGRIVELRGCGAEGPWQKADCFAEWNLDLDRPFKAIERAMASNFRRQINRGLEGSFSIEAGSGLAAVKRFYRLMLETRRRQGLPAQPWRFFQAVFETFGPAGDLEVWTISQGTRTVAGMVLISDGDDLHYKWSARVEPTPRGAMHCLITAVLEAYAHRRRTMGLGRTDVRNVGLSRFKKELGARPRPLPYAFLPQIPRQVSAEVLGSRAQIFSNLWRRLPLPVAQAIGGVVYPYLV
jgi:hypothetical protein